MFAVRASPLPPSRALAVDFGRRSHVRHPALSRASAVENQEYDSLKRQVEPADKEGN